MIDTNCIFTLHKKNLKIIPNQKNLHRWDISFPSNTKNRPSNRSYRVTQSFIATP